VSDLKYRNVKRDARLWFRNLNDTQKGDLGDALVVGTFDWREWFETRPVKGFMAAVDAERILWEMETSA
jgi:hypothetical protein